MKNILVVNVNWIGDVVFSTPVFRALRHHYPDAKICCMAVPRVVPVLQCCPYVDDVIIYDDQGADKWLWRKWMMIRRLRRFHFDAAFLLHRSWTRAFLVYLAGVKIRVGYDLKDLGRLLTHTVDVPDPGCHRSDYYLRVIESYGVPVSDRTVEVVPRQDDRIQIRSYLALKGVGETDFLVIVNAGGNWDLKRWSKENFALLVEHLTRQMRAKVVLTGAEKDIPLVNDIRDQSRSDAIVLAGKTQLPTLFALMERADLVISSDSGPLHIASSVGTDTIAIFGPTRPEVTGPRGRGCSVVLQKELPCNITACYRLDCPDNQCMRQVVVDDVLREAGTFYMKWQQTHGTRRGEKR